jgi:hypothetical protein
MVRSKYLVILLLALYLGLANSTTATAVPIPASTWTWPIDHTFIVLNNAKYNTTLENTGYAVRNLDLVYPSIE